MRTATHLGLRITEADRCYSMPCRRMPTEEFVAYVRRLLVYNGFDLTRKIFMHSVSPCDYTLVQEI